jgi:hypothetical protein
MSIYTWLYETNNFIFNIAITIIWILIFLSFVNFYSEKTRAVLSVVSYYIRIYVCVFLIVRFNPFYSIFMKKKFIFTELDRKIAYSSGITILTTDINIIQSISILLNKFNIKLL